MDKVQLLAHLSEFEALLADGFEEALIGYAFRNGPVALYESDRCIKILIERDGMSPEEAIEFFEFNVLGAWVGEKTPIFASLIV